MTARPLHVEVAAAIGWTSVQSIGPRASSGGAEEWMGRRR